MAAATEPVERGGISTRVGRTEARERKGWTPSPVRIDRAECITCDECVRACPPQFDAIVHHRGSLVVIPELCSGCGKCVPPCPVDCIHPDPQWQPAPTSWWDSAAVQSALQSGGSRQPVGR